MTTCAPPSPGMIKTRRSPRSCAAPTALQHFPVRSRQVENLEPRETLVLPPLGMDVFSYPHREGARMTMEIVLAWMDEGEDPGVDMVLIVTNEQSFLKNMKTVYRESEDQFPGVDRTREYRKGKFE